MTMRVGVVIYEVSNIECDFCQHRWNAEIQVSYIEFGKNDTHEERLPEKLECPACGLMTEYTQ